MQVLSTSPDDVRTGIVSRPTGETYTPLQPRPNAPCRILVASCWDLPAALSNCGILTPERETWSELIEMSTIWRV